MSGFLNKKERVLDFNLTELGREILSRGELDFNLATVSDKSIVYREKDIENIRKISDSEYLYNAFEINTSFFNHNILGFESNIKDFKYINPTNQTGIERLVSNKILSTKKINFLEEIDLKKSYLPTDIDFYNENAVFRYPTINSLLKSSKELNNIFEDFRFSKINSIKKMSPINYTNKEKIKEEVSPYYNERIFKSLKGFKDSFDKDYKDEIDFIQNSKDIKKIMIALTKQSDDSFMFEINEVLDDETNKKLSVIKFDQYISGNKLKKVYLVGKFKENKYKSKLYAIKNLFDNFFTDEETTFDDIISKVYYDISNKNLEIDFSKPQQLYVNSIYNILHKSFLCLFTVVIE